LKIFPIQSASADTVLILKEYERIGKFLGEIFKQKINFKGIVHLRKWPKCNLKNFF